MPVLTGKVVNGVVEVEGHLLEEGMTVMILVPDDAEEGFYLTREMQAELEESIAQADRGETIPAEVVLKELRKRTRALKSGVASSR